MFVSNETVDVTDDNGNTVVIRAKMNLKQRNQFESGLVKMRVGEDEPNTEALVGAGNLALLKINIVSWRGPAFEGFPCTPENIERLDPNEPLIDKVLAEINKRNKAKQSPNPK